MTASCQPLPRTGAEEMLQVAARALCDRTGDSPEQRRGLTSLMVLTTLGMAPRDGLEFMLATLAFGHFQIILDTMSDVFRGETDALKAKTRTSIVPLGRAMLGMIRELRLSQVRPEMQTSANAQTEDAVGDMPQPTAASPPPAATPHPETLTEEELETLSDPRLGLPAEVIAWIAGTGSAVPASAAPEPNAAGPGERPPAPTNPGEVTAADQPPCNVFSLAPPPAARGDHADPAAWEDAGTSGEQHIVSYPETLAAGSETMAQERVEIRTAKAAGGD